MRGKMIYQVKEDKLIQIGKSFQLAKEKESEKVCLPSYFITIQKLLITKLMTDLLKNQESERKRSSDSARAVFHSFSLNCQFAQEEIARLEPSWIKRALLQSIQKQEKLRAKYLVEKYLAEKSDHVPNIEIPSNPTHKVRNMDENYDETRYEKRNILIWKVITGLSLHPFVVQQERMEPVRIQKQKLLERHSGVKDGLKRKLKRRKYSKVLLGPGIRMQSTLLRWSRFEDETLTEYVEKRGNAFRIESTIYSRQTEEAAKFFHTCIGICCPISRI